MSLFDGSLNVMFVYKYMPYLMPKVATKRYSFVELYRYSKRSESNIELHKKTPSAPSTLLSILDIFFI